MTTFEEPLSDSSHVDFRTIRTDKEETNKESHFMRLAKELKFFIRRENGLENEISFFFKAFVP